MAAPTALTVPTILESAKLAQGYAAIDRAKKQFLYGGIINNLMPEKIYLIRKSIQNVYTKAQFSANATASITITSVPNDGYNIEVFVTDPAYGSISLGSYIKSSGDTTTTILAASIADELALNSYGYVVSSNVNIVSITARTGIGSSINGNNLAVTATTTDEHNAKAFFGPARVITGTVFTTTADDPDLGTITLSVYTQQAGDTTQDIFIANLKASIDTNIYGYTTLASGSNAFYIVAPTGYGATINGNDAIIAWNASTESGAFIGGVSQIGIIPNTLTQFSGGVTETASGSGFVGAANYLWSLLGVYGLRALSALGQAGGEVIVIPTGSAGVVISIAGQIVELVVNIPSEANPSGSPTPNDGDMVVTLNYRVMPNSENIFYQGVIVKKYGEGATSDFYYIPIYGATTTTYTFKYPLSEGFALKFDFMKIVSEGSGGTGTLGNGLQAVYVVAPTTGNTLTVGELGTFMFASIRNQTWDSGVITQTGQDLDLTNVGGAIAGEIYLIFYYPSV